MVRVGEGEDCHDDEERYGVGEEDERSMKGA